MVVDDETTHMENIDGNRKDDQSELEPD